MKTSQSVTHFYNYQRRKVKKNTLRNYEFVLDNFQKHFGDKDLSLITSETFWISCPNFRTEPNRI
jgi:hypothetical protein